MSKGEITPEETSSPKKSSPVEKKSKVKTEVVEEISPISETKDQPTKKSSTVPAADDTKGIGKREEKDKVLEETKTKTKVKPPSTIQQEPTTAVPEKTVKEPKQKDVIQETTTIRKENVTEPMKQITKTVREQPKKATISNISEVDEQKTGSTDSIESIVEKPVNPSLKDKPQTKDKEIDRLNEKQSTALPKKSFKEPVESVKEQADLAKPNQTANKPATVQEPKMDKLDEKVLEPTNKTDKIPEPQKPKTATAITKEKVGGIQEVPDGEMKKLRVSEVPKPMQTLGIPKVKEPGAQTQPHSNEEAKKPRKLAPAPTDSYSGIKNMLKPVQKVGNCHKRKKSRDSRVCIINLIKLITTIISRERTSLPNNNSFFSYFHDFVSLNYQHNLFHTQLLHFNSF